MNTNTLRLSYPQWQGGDPGYLMERLGEFSKQDATQGYILGSKILNLLVPPSDGPSAEIPISTSFTDDDLAVIDGIYAKKPILKQLTDAISIIKSHQPQKIITLGGECSVSLAPFSYLCNKYENDIAAIWFDAHPDFSLPKDSPTDIGFHAMPVSHLLGMGDQEVLSILPGKLPASNLLYAGLRATMPYHDERIKSLGIPRYTPQELRKNPNVISDWLKSKGCSKVIIHLDLDCIDPQELIAAVGRDPDGMKINEVIENIVEISKICEIVGFSVTEHMPTVEMKLRNLLHSLPVFD
ncbi:arginase [Tritrichomonas foetus]|uniref:Arginase n=1 Tax=Tritrichomonas foetus TaxID=1144522 RepID=A0A1J4K9A6_9EUKA|nr:arginase [Tritrichomonas foetus]|eukprot:OHT07803.1 arginase [Tritrichomonas foetus]